MNNGRTVFSQLMDYLPTYEFQKCVRRYCGDYRSRNLTCRDQFPAMAFAAIDLPRESPCYRESGLCADSDRDRTPVACSWSHRSGAESKFACSWL